VRRQLVAPFPYFGGKRKIADEVWRALGPDVKSYTEPFAGSLAVLLSSPHIHSLEVVGDANGFLANFWRGVKHQPAEVARWADYPVSHVDLGARHVWMMSQRDRLSVELQDPDWPGDPKLAGWWLWGQCAWIGSGWCNWFAASGPKVPHMGNAGMGINAIGQVPHMGNAGMGINAIGQVPYMSSAGMGYLTTAGDVAHRALSELSARLARVVIVHGEWSRCINDHHGNNQRNEPGAAVFLDPPYARASDAALYGCRPVFDEVVEWCSEHGREMRVVLACLDGQASIPGWRTVKWSRPGATYGSSETNDDEILLVSPACPERRDVAQQSLFGDATPRSTAP
jgi:DNA adenine methylase